MHTISVHTVTEYITMKPLNVPFRHKARLKGTGLLWYNLAFLSCTALLWPENKRKLPGYVRIITTWTHKTKKLQGKWFQMGIVSTSSLQTVIATTCSGQSRNVQYMK